MSNYFNQIPNFEYVNRFPDAKISDYIQVKNLFKRAFLRDDIAKDVTLFTKYKIKGDERPDNVAFKIYNDSSLDWVVLISNNIININTEWPLAQNTFDKYLIKKYGTYDNLYNGIHHYETTEVKNTMGVVLVRSGLKVESNYAFTYYDSPRNRYYTEYPVVPVTNYEYEERLEDDKRNIFLIEPRYIKIVKNDLKDMMKYKKGSTQYVNRTLKRGDNINLFS